MKDFLDSLAEWIMSPLTTFQKPSIPTIKDGIITFLIAVVFIGIIILGLYLT